MANKTRKVAAGNEELYEIVENDDGVTVTVRSTEDESEHIIVLKSMIPILVDSLQEFRHH